MCCTSTDCKNNKFARNLCKSCYDKWYRTTDKGKERRTIAQQKIASTEKRKLYCEEYRQLYKKRRNTLRNIRKKTDIQYRLSEALRKRTYSALKNNLKSGSAIRDLGCSLEELKSYLESKFQPGMSWDNYGRKSGIKCWEIDHIRPLKAFKLSNIEEFKKASNFTNLQPLWAEDNMKKRDKYLEEDNYVYKIA